MTDPEHNPTIQAMDSKTNRSPLASLDDSIDFIVSGSEDRARRDRESRTHNDQQIAEEAELHRATVAGIKIAFEKSTRTEHQTRETDLETENGEYETAVKELHRNHRSKRKRIEAARAMKEGLYSTLALLFTIHTDHLAEYFFNTTEKNAEGVLATWLKRDQP